MKPNAADARSVDQLLALVERGARPKYIFFWGHTPKVPGRIDHTCFSNWFPAPFELDAVRYPTAEHYIMAQKAWLFGDADRHEEIIISDSPGKAKALGRQVRGFREDEWGKNRFFIVVKGNLAKFRQNREMGEFLLQSGTKVLVEASPRDRIWGIGMAKDDPRAEDPARWLGLNLLGFALMTVRAALAE